MVYRSYISLCLLLLSLWLPSRLHAQSLASVADGKADATAALQQAIDRAAASHTRLDIPAGRYRITTLHLRSDLTLRLAKGAVLLADTVLTHYPRQAAPEDKDREKDRQPYHLIVADSAENMTIEGEGEINGQGPAFWHKDRPDAWHFFRELPERVSPMLELRRCRNVRISGITIANSPGWTLHLFCCDSLAITGIRIENNLFGPNTDGIDINGCRNVRISECRIRAGDDAIVCKTTRDARSCRNVAVTDCELETNCAALKLGTESFHNFDSIRFSNCSVLRSTRMMEITICDGGTARHIRFEGITGQTNAGWPLGRPIVINLNQRTDSSRKGGIDDVRITGCRLRSDGRILIGAAPGMPAIRHVRLERITHQLAMLDDPQPISAAIAADRTYGKGLPGLRSARAAIALEHVDSSLLKDVTIAWPTYPVRANWRLLQSSWRSLNPAYYGAGVPAIRSGNARPNFVPLYQAGCNGLVIQNLKEVGGRQ